MNKLFLGVLMFIGTLSFAQSGKVLDENGEPQAGCRITSLATNTTVYTDFDGNYTIDAPQGSLLEFQFISYQTDTIPSRDSLVVSLKEYKLCPTEDLIN